MDAKTQPTDDASSHQETLATDPPTQPTAQAQHEVLADGKPPNLTKANMKFFNKAADVEEAQRRGIAVPEGHLDPANCSSTSSERLAKALEQVQLRVAPELRQQVAEMDEYFDNYNAQHNEEMQRQRDELLDQQIAERERIRKAAVNEALERIRKVPYNQAPTLRQRGELHWAEEEAWFLRDLEPRDDIDTAAAIQPGPDAAEPPAADAPASNPGRQGEKRDCAECTAEGHGYGHGHGNGQGDDAAAAGAAAESEDEEIPAWAKAPGWIELYGPYKPAHKEPWITKQQRLAREREQMYHNQEDQGQQTQGQEQQSTRLEHFEFSPPPSDRPRSGLSSVFSGYHRIHDKDELDAYIANASYAVSIGGPPCADLNYGIAIFPVGEESTVFGQQPCDVMTPSFIQEVYDARYDRQVAERAKFRKASHGSVGFLRPRSKSVAADDRSLHSLGDLVDPAVTAGPDGGHSMHEGSGMPQPTAFACAPQSTDFIPKAVDADRTDRLDVEEPI